MTLYERDFLDIDDVTNAQLWMKALNLAGLDFGNDPIVTEKRRPWRLEDRFTLAGLGRPITKALKGEPQSCMNLQQRKLLLADTQGNVRSVQ